LTALYISSDISVHHKEHRNCIYSFWYYSRMSWAAGVMDELELSPNLSMTPAGSNLGEYYQVLYIQLRCSWWRAKISLETCKAVKEQYVILHSCKLLVVFVNY